MLLVKSSDPLGGMSEAEMLSSFFRGTQGGRIIYRLLDSRNCDPLLCETLPLLGAVRITM